MRHVLLILVLSLGAVAGCQASGGGSGAGATAGGENARQAVPKLLEEYRPITPQSLEIFFLEGAGALKTRVGEKRWRATANQEALTIVSSTEKAVFQSELFLR